MNIKITNFLLLQDKLPENGKHILAHCQDDEIIVYQAYKPSIANYAVAHQQLGGSNFSYGRMSWIKPNFMWMMYRCGWATKPDQERVLALHIGKADFETILSLAVNATYNKEAFASKEEWQKQVTNSDVRLQWDPDHDPYGKKLERRAIQLGLRNDVLKAFGTEYVKQIEDITGFVQQQKALLDAGKLEDLLTPEETVYTITHTETARRVGTDELTQ